MTVFPEKSQDHKAGEEKVTLATIKDFSVAMAEILSLVLEPTVQERILGKRNKQT